MITLYDLLSDPNCELDEQDAYQLSRLIGKRCSTQRILHMENILKNHQSDIPLWSCLKRLVSDKDMKWHFYGGLFPNDDLVIIRDCIQMAAPKRVRKKEIN